MSASLTRTQRDQVRWKRQCLSLIGHLFYWSVKSCTSFIVCLQCPTSRVFFKIGSGRVLERIPQSSYLSRISQIIWRKNMSRGEISAFYTDFEQFIEFYRHLCRFCSKSMWRKICVEKIYLEKTKDIDLPETKIFSPLVFYSVFVVFSAFLQLFAYNFPC